MKFINRKFGWLVLSLIFFSIQLNAQEKNFDDSVLSGNGKQAYQTLLKIKLFAIGGIGYSGETSEGEKMFDVLLEEKEANSVFKSLVKDGTSEGGLYGLFGLKMIDCGCFQSEFETYKKGKILDDKELFSMMSGCEFIEAENKSDKEFVINYIVSNGFEQMIKNKKIIREQRERLKYNQNSNGANKSI